MGNQEQQIVKYRESEACHNIFYPQKTSIWIFDPVNPFLLPWC